MLSTSRRGFVASATAALATFGLSGRVVFAETAASNEASTKGFYRFKVGDIEVTTVFDGLWAKPHDEGFIRNATVEETKKALAEAGLPDGNVTIPFTVTFVRTGDRLVMFDSGTGGQLAPTAGKLAANMGAAGITPESIDVIAITHFHPDHIFGLMEKGTNAPVYPKAQIFVPAKELAFWNDPGVLSKLPENRQGLARRVQATLGKWDNVTQVDDGGEILPGIVAVGAYGHTPGHTTYLLGSGKDQLMVLADITNIPALFARHPGWHAIFDTDPQAAEAARRRMFDRVVAEGAIMTGYHYGMPGAGRIEKDGSGYAFLPLG